MLPLTRQASACYKTTEFKTIHSQSQSGLNSGEILIVKKRLVQYVLCNAAYTTTSVILISRWSYPQDGLKSQSSIALGYELDIYTLKYTTLWEIHIHSLPLFSICILLRLLQQFAKFFGDVANTLFAGIIQLWSRKENKHIISMKNNSHGNKLSKLFLFSPNRLTRKKLLWTQYKFLVPFSPIFEFWDTVVVRHVSCTYLNVCDDSDVTNISLDF